MADGGLKTGCLDGVIGCPVDDSLFGNEPESLLIFYYQIKPKPVQAGEVKIIIEICIP